MSILPRLLAFLDDSPSPFHAARTVARALDAAGFVRADERAGAASLEPGADALDRRRVTSWLMSVNS